MKKWILAAVLLLAVLIWAGPRIRTWRWANGEDPNNQRPATAIACVTNIQFAITAAGDIGPADQVSVRPEINGKIAILAVDIGDKVTKGKVLFALDDTDLQTERSSRLTDIEGARLQVERSRRNYERSVKLFQEKLISQELYENTKIDFSIATNSLERAQKELNILDDKLTKTKILAPFDCTILTRPVSIGQAVSGSGGYNSGTEVLTIANLSEMIVNAHINQADVTRLRMGQSVDMEVEAVPGLKMRGTIERIAPQSTIRNGIKGFATRILLSEVDPRVRPGMTANLSIPVANVENAITVPLAAVCSDMGERYVWVVKEDRDGDYQYERRPVLIGVADYSHVEIQSGLKSGETVALEQPPARVLDALGLGSEKKYSAGLMPGGGTNRQLTSTITTNRLPTSTNVLAATTNRLSGPGISR